MTRAASAAGGRPDNGPSARVERTHLIGLIEAQRQDGPCLDTWRSGEAAREDQLSGAEGRWPHFLPAALDSGFASAYAVPMRLRDQRLGALNLFANHTSGLVGSDEALAQAMADVATIGILHERFLTQRQEVVAQLQMAFDTRVVLEQAKDVVAEAAKIDMDGAFALLRGYARHHNLVALRRRTPRHKPGSGRGGPGHPPRRPVAPPPLSPAGAGHDGTVPPARSLRSAPPGLAQPDRWWEDQLKKQA